MRVGEVLQPFGPGIWIAEGPQVVAAAGFHYPTRMALVQLPDGGLLVWSPIPWTPDLLSEVDALGPVTHILAPNSLHHLSVPDWQAAYPKAQILAAPGLAKRCPQLKIDHTLGDLPGDWRDVLDLCLVHGNAITTEAVLFHRPSGTVIFTDLLQQMPRDWYHGWRRIVARLDLMTQPEPTVPRKFRMAFKNKRAARQAVQKILGWPAQQVLMAHGTPVRTDAPALLRRAFRWLVT